MKKSTLSLLVAAIVMTSACKKETEFVEKPYDEMAAKWKEHRREDGMLGNVKSHTKTEYHNGILTTDGKISGGYPVYRVEIIYNEKGYRIGENESEFLPSEIKRAKDQSGNDVIVITKTAAQLLFGRTDERDSRNRTVVKDIKTRDVAIFLNDNHYENRIYFGAPGDTIWTEHIDDATKLLIEVDSTQSHYTYAYDDANRKATEIEITGSSKYLEVDSIVRTFTLNEYLQIDEEDSRTVTYNNLVYNTKNMEVTEKVVVERDAIGNITREYIYKYPESEDRYYVYIVHEYVFY